MTAGVAGMVLHEHVVLHKFEGDDQTQAPFASIVIDNGTITSRCDQHDWQTLPETVAFDSEKVCVICGEEWGVNGSH